MKEGKPKILLCWGYERPGWIKYFERLNNDFEFIYLYYYRKEDETLVYTDNQRIYFTDFKSPFEILKKFRFSSVIFMGLDGWLSVAINLAARQLNIRTYIMMHGSASKAVEDYKAISYNRKLPRNQLSRKLKNLWFALRFVLYPFRIKYLKEYFVLFRFQFQQTRMHPIFALKKNKSWIRNPDFYIVFSRFDIKYFQEVDGALEEQFIVLGNLEITSFVEYAQVKGVNEESYMLYVETPLSRIAGVAFDVNLLSPEEYNQLLNGMNEYAMGRGLRLFVKLHPYSYKNDYYFEHSNINYIRDSEIEPLLLNAKCVVGYNSSLMIPAALYKECLLFTIGKPDQFQKNMEAAKACKLIDYKSFSDKSRWQEIEFRKADRKTFTENFIAGNDDGQGLARLKSILLGKHTQAV